MKSWHVDDQVQARPKSAGIGGPGVIGDSHGCVGVQTTSVRPLCMRGLEII